MALSLSGRRCSGPSGLITASVIALGVACVDDVRAEGGAASASAPRIILKMVVVDSDGPVPAADLEALASDLIGQPVSYADLERLRRTMTALLVSRGYVSSGVLIPDQEVDQGRVTFQVVYGRVDELVVTGTGVGGGGLGDLDPAYVAARALPAEPDAPFNANDMRRRLELLLDDRNVAAIRGAIRPGEGVGDTVVDLEVTTPPPLSASLVLDNNAPPSLGEERLVLSGVARNLGGFGDQLAAEVEVSSGAARLRASVDAPVAASDAALFAYVEAGDAEIIEPPLDVLDIESDVRRLGLGVRLPVYRSGGFQVVGDGAIEFARSETRLLGEPFSFSPTAPDGVVRLTMARIGHALVSRGAETTIAARSQFTFGFDAFGATAADQEPDAVFAHWIGQGQIVHQLTPATTVIARAQAQLASGSLPALEAAAIGGRDSVRGVRRAALVNDQAATATLEARYVVARLPAPLVTPPGHEADLVVAPFIDVGTAWAKAGRRGAETIAGAGAGLFWSPRPGLALSVQVAATLADGDGAAARGDSLQDQGIYFAISASLP